MAGRSGASVAGKVRILVVGDTGVGKSSLVHLLCHNEVLRAPLWTVGCALDVARFRSSDDQHYWIEYWDVAGADRYKPGRSLFYTQQINGLILVHDLTNRKSYSNLRRWLREIIDCDHRSGSDDYSTAASASASVAAGTAAGFGASSVSRHGDSGRVDEEEDLELELHVGDRVVSLPVLVVGTHIDCMPGMRSSDASADQHGWQSIEVNCQSASSLAAMSPNRTKVDTFLRRVIQRRRSPGHATPGGTPSRLASYGLPSSPLFGGSDPVPAYRSRGTPTRSPLQQQAATLASSPEAAGIASGAVLYRSSPRGHPAGSPIVTRKSFYRQSQR